MSTEHLTVYLHDHRAGAASAVALLDHLERSHADTPVGRFAAGLRTEILADVHELDGVMSRAGIRSSATRNATGWLAGLAAEIKMRVEDPGDGELRLLEIFEALALGIEGKRALWNALAAVATEEPLLSTVDYTRLIQRAEQQRGMVETQRMAAARAALSDVEPDSSR